jgi:hypothetical protein
METKNELWIDMFMYPMHNHIALSRVYVRKGSGILQ